MKLPKKYLSNIPLIALLVANVIPLWGVLFLGWDAFLIVLLYWTENLVVGFYNVLKMALACPPETRHPATHLSKLFFIPFFIIHYGGFTAVHGLFVLSMFEKGEGQWMAGDSWPCFLVFVQLLLNVIRQMFSAVPPAARFVFLCLFISHGISFVYNYLLKREFASARVDKLMGAPYSRVVVMHISILGGCFLLVAVGSPVTLLLVLVVLKTALDVTFHLREHRKKTQVKAR
jgi:hypothetical protein